MALVCQEREEAEVRKFKPCMNSVDEVTTLKKDHVAERGDGVLSGIC